ncbi:hypothetical protein SUGI_0447420 [Cryptomeria japonica]|nr:hypothetical protein SUGI_0447420 [Cryptomeria japonica]
MRALNVDPGPTQGAMVPVGRPGPLRAPWSLTGAPWSLQGAMVPDRGAMVPSGCHGPNQGAMVPIRAWRGDSGLAYDVRQFAWAILMIEY